MALFRKGVFWLHLVAGLVSGLVIAIMCFTGAVLAFEKQIVALAERDVARIAAPAGDAARVPLDRLLQQARAARPDARPASLTVTNDPAAAVAIAFGRDGIAYVNPYTGEIPPTNAKRMRAFMHFVTDLHRRLAFETGAPRTIGLALTGACNAAFFVLAATGLYLWWPRSWSWRGFKAIAVFNFRLAGRGRDFNWHNSIGLWTAPVLIVLTLTALPISYRWANNLVYTLTGNKPPVQAGRGPGPGATAAVSTPPAGAQPVGYDALLASIASAYPDWRDVTFRFGAPRGAAGLGGGQRRAAVAEARGSDMSDRHSQTPQAVGATLRTAGQRPSFATTSLALDPFTGAVLRAEPFASHNTGRRLRIWTRFLHTGEAFGWPGQLIAGLASLLALVLVWTGFTLSWRRFFPPRSA